MDLNLGMYLAKIQTFAGFRLSISPTKHIGQALPDPSTAKRGNMKLDRMNPVRTIIGMATLGLTGCVFADASIDRNGFGFVARGDVQAMYDWSNSALQDNAHLVSFRYGGGNTATWACSHLARQGQARQAEEVTIAIDAGIALDPRKNSAGQITGFNLNGFRTGAETYTAVGTCPSGNPGGEWQLIADSIMVEGSGEPILQVSIDGVEWHDLTITY